MTAKELREKFLRFMESKGHAIIPSASLVPENDPSVLFTTAGMHPLVPYLLGEKHPGGSRVANVQKCIRTVDIDEVGDNRHLTFFEMMGNWSFGDYFKKEAIEWSWEFLTDKKMGLCLNPQRIYVTVFKGEDGIPRDEEAINIWKEIFKKTGIKAEVAGEDEIVNGDVRIIPLGKEDNFWIAKETGPCGGDTEMFYDTRPNEGKINDKFSNLVDNFRLIELWNDVFMEFNRTAQGKYEKLAKPNVDTGMGVERTLAVLNCKENVFETELFLPIFAEIEKMSSKKFEEEAKSFRVIADHIKAAVFMISDGVIPSNVQRGYVLRRLIRRAIRHAKLIGIENKCVLSIASSVIKIYKDFYPELHDKNELILSELEKEEDKFRNLLKNKENKKNKILDEQTKLYYEWCKKNVGLNHSPQVDNHEIYYDTSGVSPSAEAAFELETTDGYPSDLFYEEFLDKIKNKKFIDKSKRLLSNKYLKEHKEKSRTASAGMFKGGLADASEETKKLHTAAHLLLAALRKVLGESVIQKGSNITSERLRFDFSHNEKMTPEQIKEVEKLVNDAIAKNLPVVCQEMSLEEAKKKGAMGVFDSKYGEQVKVYSIGEISNEICGGPHAERTGALGKFKILKEESSSAGVRRIKGVLE